MMLTITVIKADIGSVGGHTRPSKKMIKFAKGILEDTLLDEVLTDYEVTYTGDDVCLLMTHSRGTGSEYVHNVAWNVFESLTEIAENEGLYGAGQDLLADAPSGNVRGAGPGVAEITFDETKIGNKKSERPAEPFLVFAADKCGPGAFNFPLWAVFTSPMYCAGLLMPKMKTGFTFTVIDMDHAKGDSISLLDAPERHLDLAVLLKDENRFGIQAIHSRRYPAQQVVSVSTDRLHTIAGKYTGKDDPVAIVRAQGIFPAPEEIVSPWVTCHFVAGDARGSHHMPIMPVAINTAVAGIYCLPIVSCLGYSINRHGKLSEHVDIFGNVAWDSTRLKAQRKGIDMRQQGFVGAAMLPNSELEYGALRDSLRELEEEFITV